MAEIKAALDRLPAEALRVVRDTAQYFLSRDVPDELIPPPPPEADVGPRIPFDPHDTL